jgi:hypothetical protein
MKDIRMRRLTREVEAIQEIYKNTSLIIEEEESDNIIYNVVVKLNNINTILSFRCDNYYPFKAPIVYYENTNTNTNTNTNAKKNYLNKLCIKHPYINYIFRKDEISCACCLSVLCNWSAGCRIVKIINEYIYNHELFNKCMYYDILLKSFNKININAIELVEKIMDFI